MALQYGLLPQVNEQLSLVGDRSIPLASRALSREDIISLDE